MEQASGEITERICELVSEAQERPVTNLPPLSKAIDPEALDRLVHSTGDNTKSPVAVSFTYAGQHVQVSPGRVIYVGPATDAREGGADEE